MELKILEIIKNTLLTGIWAEDNEMPRRAKPGLIRHSSKTFLSPKTFPIPHLKL
jgi:hypothetical protein